MVDQPKQLWDAETRRVVIAQLEIADSLWKQGVGLMGRKRLEPDSGFYLEPCNGVHTLGMKFAIDLLFLDKNAQAIKLVPNVKPWRICGPVFKARAVVELPAGSLAGRGIRLGRRYIVATAL